MVSGHIGFFIREIRVIRGPSLSVLLAGRF